MVRLLIAFPSVARENIIKVIAVCIYGGKINK